MCAHCRTVVGRNPSFVNGRLVSQYNDCSPECAAGHTYDVVWTFRPGPDDFWAPNPPGWTAPAGAENAAAGPGQGPDRPGPFAPAGGETDPWSAGVPEGLLERAPSPSYLR